MERLRVDKRPVSHELVEKIHNSAWIDELLRNPFSFVFEADFESRHEECLDFQAFPDDVLGKGSIGENLRIGLKGHLGSGPPCFLCSAERRDRQAPLELLNVPEPIALHLHGHGLA